MGQVGLQTFHVETQLDCRDLKQTHIQPSHELRRWDRWKLRRGTGTDQKITPRMQATFPIVPSIPIKPRGNQPMRVANLDPLVVKLFVSKLGLDWNWHMVSMFPVILISIPTFPSNAIATINFIPTQASHGILNLVVSCINPRVHLSIKIKKENSRQKRFLTPSKG